MSLLKQTTGSTQMNNSNDIDTDFIAELAIDVAMELDTVDNATARLNAEELDVFRTLYEEAIKQQKEMNQ